MPGPVNDDGEAHRPSSEEELTSDDDLSEGERLERQRNGGKRLRRRTEPHTANGASRDATTGEVNGAGPAEQANGQHEPDKASPKAVTKAGKGKDKDDEEKERTRHGFGDVSEEYLNALEKNYFLYWMDMRHERAGERKPPSKDPLEQKIDWRNRDRVRTALAVLVVCLRIGYDPPDIIKTDPCAKLECWVDPYVISKEKAMERIGKNLQSQFESLAPAPKTRYKQYLDPPIEDARRFCSGARKSAKNERVLFYYNGHGVPKPTPSGELWLFNKQYTQYIPVSLADIVAWLGSPAILVWDCSAAGNIVSKVTEFGIKRDADLAREAAAPPPPAAAAGSAGAQQEGEQAADPRPQIPTVPFRETIQLGACLGHESLPMNPDLPADLFTCCLTSPIEIALRFFLLRNPLKPGLTLDMLLKIPGRLNDRRTPLGELMWIFTAVTDTIAWNTLPRELFQKLFRHDLVVAALFRGFLLAERIMRFYECTPVSTPALPQTHNHPLWDSWDMAVDMCLAQLPLLLEHQRKWEESQPPQPETENGQPAPIPPGPPLPYVHTTFFAEQLTAFELWLERGAGGGKKRHPQQLPVVLQVLLSQAHRLKALILLCKFLDLGPWAVNVALSIGIFAYVLRLLQAPAAELKPVLIYIWARILAVYESCKEDLLKQTYPVTTARATDFAPYIYFVNVIMPGAPLLPVANVSEHRAMCFFILSVCSRDHKPGQIACLRSHVFDASLHHLKDGDPLLRQWCVISIGSMWDDFEEAKGHGIRARVHEIFCNLLHQDDSPEVRGAILFALGTLLGTTTSSNPAKKFGRSIACSSQVVGLSAIEQTDVELGIAMSTLKCSVDGSPIVRRELVILLSAIVNEHQGQFVVAAYRAILERMARPGDNRRSFITASLAAAAEMDDGPSNPQFQATMFLCMYRVLFGLAADPHPDIAELAGQVLDFISTLLFESPLASAAHAALDNTPDERKKPPPEPGVNRFTANAVANGHTGPKVTGFAATAPPPAALDTIKRTASIATAVGKLAHLTTAPSTPADTSPAGSVHRLSPQSAATPLPSTPSTESLRYLQSRAGGRPTRKMPALEDSAAVEAIIAELVAADEQRLERKRQAPAGAAATTTTDGKKPKEEARQVLPLKSEFFDFSVEYFTESQMKNAEPDEPGSVIHNERLWRRQRNEEIIIKTQPLKELAAKSRWEEPLGTFNAGGSVRHLLLHQFEPHLVAADEKGFLTTYDWQRKEVTNRFINGGPTKAPITSAKFVNEDDVAILLTGASDGHVRLYRSYEDSNEVAMISSFRGVTDIIRSSHQEAGLVVDWQQGRGNLLMGGNVKYIRVWDALREMAVQDLPTHSNSCLSSLTSDQVAGDILTAGFGDGTVKVLDRRLPPRENVVQSWKGYHSAWVQNVHMQRGGDRELLSGSLAGEVCMWDIRQPGPLKFIQAHQGAMAALAVHEHAPVFATGTAQGLVKVWNIKDGTPISQFRSSAASYSITHKPAPMTALAFHPHHMTLSTGAQDGQVQTFQIDGYRDILSRKEQEAILLAA